MSGIPVKHYVAVVELTDDGSGTTIRWSARFDRTLGGRLVRRRLQRVYDTVVERVVTAADHQLSARSRPEPAG